MKIGKIFFLCLITIMVSFVVIDNNGVYLTNNYVSMAEKVIHDIDVNYDFDYYEEKGDKQFIDELDKLQVSISNEKAKDIQLNINKDIFDDENNKNSGLQKTDTIPSRNYTVVIDPGHGGIDPGSIGYKTKVHEAELNLKMSLKLKEKLENASINVVMTRETEAGLADGNGKGFKKKDMALRKEIIKKVRPNMVISLHQNSYTNHKLRGAQVFYDKTSEISKQIAQYIQEEFLLSLDYSNKTISPGDYFMLKCTSAPSVIVECGFLSNAEEEQLLLSDEYQDKVLDCVFKGIVKFLQIH